VFPGVFGGADQDGAGGAVVLAVEGAAGDVGGEGVAEGGLAEAFAAGE
jgi:hypothetical protein